VRLREEFGLYANIRPVRTIIPGQRYDNIDLVLIRENLEGLYIAFEHYVPIGNDPHAAAIASGVNTKAGAHRIISFAFEYALRNGRKKVTVVHKANVLKALTGLFLEIGREVGKQYEGRIEMNDRIVDSCAMQLVLDPWQFDVIVTTNLFGDILSDEMAGLVGGLGLAPGANIGASAAMFEAVHGSAPDIAGKHICNPIGQIWSAGMMLQHLGEDAAGEAIVRAIETLLREAGPRTRDMGGQAGTAEVGTALAEIVAKG